MINEAYALDIAKKIKAQQRQAMKDGKYVGGRTPYQLFITEAGLAALKQGYESILQPFYDLWRSSGEDFEAFMYYADRLATHIEKGQGKTRDHKVL